MFRAVYILGFVGTGLLLWYVVAGVVFQLAELIGGQLEEAIRNGGPEFLGMWSFIGIGILLGSFINAMLGNWAAGGYLGRPDYSFYIVALLEMIGFPFVVLCLGLCRVVFGQL